MMPSETTWHDFDVECKGIAGSPQESPGRATYLLIRSVKSNKELLLTEVTRPPANTPGTRLGGRKKKEWRNYGKNNIICKRKRQLIP